MLDIILTQALNKFTLNKAAAARLSGDAEVVDSLCELQWAPIDRELREPLTN